MCAPFEMVQEKWEGREKGAARVVAAPEGAGRRAVRG